MDYNLVYMAKPVYGGWVSFTAHLSNKYKNPLYKIGKRNEKKTRKFDENSQNIIKEYFQNNKLLKKKDILNQLISEKNINIGLQTFNKIINNQY